MMTTTHKPQPANQSGTRDDETKTAIIAENTAASDLWLIVSFLGYVAIAGILVFFLVGTPQTESAAPTRTIGSVRGAPLDAAITERPEGVTSQRRPIAAAGTEWGGSIGSTGDGKAPPSLDDMTQFILKAPPAETRTPDGYLIVSFATLSNYFYEQPLPDDLDSFAFDPHAAPLRGEIPEAIRKLDGEKIVVTGFAWPFEIDGSASSSFLLLGTQAGCCFGGVPRINDWIEVKMQPGKTAQVFKDWPFAVYGTFHVGEVFEDGGYLTSIYRLTADRVIDAYQDSLLEK